MTRTFASAALMSVAAVVAGAVALTPAPVAVRVVSALPLVFVLPGFALASALFPPSMGWIERLLVSLGFSFAVCIIGGFVLNWTVGITKVAWIVILVATTVAGAFFAHVRASRTGERASDLVGRLRPAGIPVRAMVLALCSLVLAVGAVGLARSALPGKGIEGYTGLWLVPAENAGALKIGVSSSELHTTTYRVELRAGGESLVTRSLTLKTGQEWDATVDVSSVPVSRRSFEALLYRSGESQTPYRRATALFAGTTAPPTTALWLVPGAPETDTVRVLVTSAELSRTSFRVEVLADGQLVDVSTLTLDPGAREVVEVDVSSIPQDRRSFEALLYRAGPSEPPALLRRANLVDAE
jgi:hypothetical protein